MEVQREYNLATTIIFPVLVSGSTNLAATGDWTPATGDTKISKDGGNVANTTNNPAAVGGAGSVLWSLTLTATEMQASEITIQIVDSATKAIEDQVLTITTRQGHQVEASEGVIRGTVDDTTFTPTTTTLEGNRTAPNTTNEATADHYNGRLIMFLSGAAKGELSTITDYELANSKEKYTYDALVSTPVNGDRYEIL